jgi:hypothetical protein
MWVAELNTSSKLSKSAADEVLGTALPHITFPVLLEESGISAGGDWYSKTVCDSGPRPTTDCRRGCGNGVTEACVVVAPISENPYISRCEGRREVGGRTIPQR